MTNGFAQWLNHWLGKNVVAAASSPNNEGDPRGMISKLFKISFYAGKYRRAFRDWNPTFYKIPQVRADDWRAGLVYLVVGFLITPEALAAPPLQGGRQLRRKAALCCCPSLGNALSRLPPQNKKSRCDASAALLKPTAPCAAWSSVS
jgi:hypothetical protein